jgi:hypothetical protein
MSTWFNERVTCPACSHEQDARLAHGIHVTRAPEARDQIIDRTFHRITCAECSVRFVANREMVYTDMDRRHWVHVALSEQRPVWPELETVARQTFERAFIGSPLAAELRERFKVRLVFGIEELREKLVIWKANLDDRVVECAKIRMFLRDPELALAYRMLVDTVDDAQLYVNCVDHDDRPTSTFAIPQSLVEDMTAHDEELGRYFPEIFGGTFVSTHRLTGKRYRMPTPWST